jgi:hypothetical protein
MLTRSAFLKIVQGTPTVHARMRQLSLHYEDQLAQIITEEAGAPTGDPTARVVASVLGVLARLAFGVPGWPDGRPRSQAEIMAGIDAAFELFAGGLSEYAARGSEAIGDEDAIRRRSSPTE